MEKTCAVTGCDRTDLKGQGWCKKHYERARRNNGDPTYDGVAAYAQERRTKRAERAGMDEKQCSICHLTKPLTQYYKRGEWVYTWCKACHKDKMDAKRIEKQLAKPKPVPVDHGNCDFEGCTNKATVQLLGIGGPQGWYCAAHYAQWNSRQELKPVKARNKSYINDRLRQCSSCQKVKTQESFNWTSKRTTRQSECKECNYLRARFNLLMRDVGREDEVQEVYDRMPSKMQDKLKDRLEAA